MAWRWCRTGAASGLVSPGASMKSQCGAEGTDTRGSGALPGEVQVIAPLGIGDTAGCVAAGALDGTAALDGPAHAASIVVIATPATASHQVRIIWTPAVL